MNLKYYLRGLGIGIIMTSLIMGIASGDGKETLTNEEIKERAKALGMVEEGSVLADLAREEVPLSPSPVKREEAPAENSPSLEGTPQKTGLPAADSQASATPEGTPKEETSPAPSRTPEGKASPSPTPTSTPTPTATAKPSPTAVPTPVATPSPKATAAPTKSPAPTKTPAATPTASPGQEAEDSIIIQVVSGDTSYSVCKKLQEAGLITSANEYDGYLCENGYDKRINVGEFRIPKGAGKEQIAKIIARLE